MNREKLVSREYKVVLKTDNFKGPESSLKKSAHSFWVKFKKIIQPVVKEVSGDLDKKDKEQEIRFYDTTGFSLYKMDYIFRERKDLVKDTQEVTLKFHHPDRYLSQDHHMLARKIGKGEVKFEEDIKAPFGIQYSYSSNQAVKKDEPFKNLKQVIKLYPGLKSQLNKKQEEEMISVVNDHFIREAVLTGGEIIPEPKVKVECALIVQYDLKTFRPDPLIVEFSFRYCSDKEKFAGETAKMAYDLFLFFQKEMNEWIEEKNPTKTGFVYGDPKE